MNLSKISIVTPSFNQAAFLEETICSVLDQGYPDLEYIIIDGNSQDNSVEIIKKYEKHLAYWVSEPDRGHAHALNKGFAKSSGEIMAWINSDDKYLPWTFEIVNTVFNDLPEVSWIQGNPSTWDTRGRLIEAYKSQKNLLDFLTGNYAWIQQESVFWRRSLWQKAGGRVDESYKFMIDGELWSRFFLYDNLYRVNRVIGGFRMHETNRSKDNYAQCLQEMDAICAKLKSEAFGKSILSKEYRAMSFFQQLPSFLKNRITRKFLIHSLSRVQYHYIDQQNGCWSIASNPYVS